VVNRKDPLWATRVLYQAYGMAGLVKSVAAGWQWLAGLYEGPIQHMEGLPRGRLLMVPPAVRSGELALAAASA
jgi:hypothetical protein